MRITTLKRTCVLGILAALSLGATTYRYTYTGNDFTTPASSSYNEDDYVSVQLDFANLLGANLTSFDVSGELVDWSMTDQVQDFSSAGSDELQFALVNTDAGGNIDQWQLVSCDVLADCQSSNYTIATYNLTNTVIQDSGTTIGADYGLNSGSAGTWTESVVTPEPASAILLACSILALWAGKRARGSRRPNQ